MLIVNGLTKVFMPFGSEVKAIDSISFKLAKGDIMCACGPNGAGKTTLLKIIAGLIMPSAGEIKINGEPFCSFNPVLRRKIGFSSADERGFYAKLTLKENLAFFAALYGIRSTAFKCKLRELASLLEFGDYLDMEFQKLSSGFKQRASLAKAILNEPELLLIDELNKSIDQVFAAKTYTLLNKLVAEQKTTILFTAHNTSGISGTNYRLATLNNGKMEL